MKEETKKKLKKYGKLALGAALLGGAAYAGYKNCDKIANAAGKVFSKNKQENNTSNVTPTVNQQPEIVAKDEKLVSKPKTLGNGEIVGGVTGATAGVMGGNKLGEKINDRLHANAKHREGLRVRKEFNVSKNTPENFQKSADLVNKNLEKVKDRINSKYKDEANKIALNHRNAVKDITSKYDVENIGGNNRETVDKLNNLADDKNKQLKNLEINRKNLLQTVESKKQNAGSMTQRFNDRVQKAHMQRLTDINKKFTTTGKLAKIAGGTIGAAAGALGGGILGKKSEDSESLKDLISKLHSNTNE